MRSKPSIALLLAASLSVGLQIVGLLYLTIACQDLPGFMGPVAGDSSPRTGAGIAALALGASIGLAVGVALRRRRTA